jgi:hypothetical protein
VTTQALAPLRSQMSLAPNTQPPKAPERLPFALWLVPAAMLLLALAPLPYGYYMLLRLVTCGTAAALAWWGLRASSAPVLGWLMVGVAILYNPVFKIAFSRQNWSVLNVATVACFLLFAWLDYRRRPTRRLP